MRKPGSIKKNKIKGTTDKGVLKAIIPAIAKANSNKAMVNMPKPDKGLKDFSLFIWFELK